MAQIESRQALAEYALRALGAPVLEVNVADEQIEDRIDDALQFYQEYHSDATLRTFIKHQVQEADIANRYITVPENLLFVSRVLPIGGAGDARDMFSTRYQMHMSDFYGLRSGNVDIVSYEMMRQNMALVDLELNGLSQQITFSRHRNQLAIEIDWSTYLSVGDWIVIEGYVILDPEECTEIYNDRFLKKYLVQLIKQNWGQNLIKFQGMQLPGGVTMDGQKMYDDASAEIQKIEEEVQLRWSEPDGFFVG